VNLLYYGDNLDVLRRHITDNSVDLVYLDPPFKSNQDYNVLFAEKDGTRAAAQFKAFEDTWEWNQSAAAEYEAVVEAGGRVSDVMQAFRRFLGTNDMLAYLTMMAPRLIELRRVLKGTGSIYLHCDPTASHYLKLLMDAVFGVENAPNSPDTRSESTCSVTCWSTVLHPRLQLGCDSRMFARMTTPTPNITSRTTLSSI
jgi:adenine specific DNA methylase Mod